MKKRRDGLIRLKCPRMTLPLPDTVYLATFHVFPECEYPDLEAQFCWQAGKEIEGSTGPEAGSSPSFLEGFNSSSLGFIVANKSF